MSTYARGTEESNNSTLGNLTCFHSEEVQPNVFPLWTYTLTKSIEFPSAAALYEAIKPFMRIYMSYKPTPDGIVLYANY